MQFDKLQLDYYSLKDPTTKPFKLNENYNIPNLIQQLIVIVELLLNEGYTLSYICPDDFVLKDNILFLNETVHIVKIDEPIKLTKKECFHSKGLRATLKRTYASVGLFVFYLYTRKVKTSLNNRMPNKIGITFSIICKTPMCCFLTD